MQLAEQRDLQKKFEELTKDILKANPGQIWPDLINTFPSLKEIVECMLRDCALTEDMIKRFTHIKDGLI